MQTPGYRDLGIKKDVCRIEQRETTSKVMLIHCLGVMALAFKHKADKLNWNY